MQVRVEIHNNTCRSWRLSRRFSV